MIIFILDFLRLSTHPKALLEHKKVDLLRILEIRDLLMLLRNGSPDNER